MSKCYYCGAIKPKFLVWREVIVPNMVYPVMACQACALTLRQQGHSFFTVSKGEHGYEEKLAQYIANRLLEA